MDNVNVLKGKELGKCLRTATSEYFYRMLVAKSHLLWGPWEFTGTLNLVIPYIVKDREQIWFKARTGILEWKIKTM